MLLRCGGTVIEIGRSQVAVLATVAVIFLTVSAYSVSLLHGARQSDVGWIKPTPIDDILKPAMRQRHAENREQHGNLWMEGEKRHDSLKAPSG